MTWQELRRQLLEAFADEDWGLFVAIYDNEKHKLTVHEQVQLARALSLEFRHPEILKRMY